MTSKVIFSAGIVSRTCRVFACKDRAVIKAPARRERRPYGYGQLDEFFARDSFPRFVGALLAKAALQALTIVLATADSV
jgi:hypothetical protein